MSTPDEMVQEAMRLQAANRATEAMDAYVRVLKRWPTLPDCWFNLGFLLRQARRFDEALMCYQKALENGVAAPESAHLNRAVILADYLRQDAAAEAELKAALALNPEYVPALLNFAKLHEDRGQREQAQALYSQVMALDPRCFLALARFADLQPAGSFDAPLMDRLRAAIASDTTPVDDRAVLGFALGRALDAGGDYPGAFAAYTAANRDSRLSLLPVEVRYDRTAQERMTERLIAAATPPPVPAATQAGSARPIFVCGMFRSGSTLAEQLLAGYPGVAAGGELDLLPAAIAAELQPFPESLATVSAAKLAQIAGRYREQTARLFPGAQWVTDKRPDNFMCIGLIKTLFPDALIVHTTRDPIDTCLSTFFLHLDHRMSYALDLMDVGHYYRQYRRLMAHWNRLYGADILTLDYDALVHQPETTAAALFASLGWVWDPRVLDFAAANRTVRTASLWQVREPLYRRSSGRASHYALEVAPLRAYLADLLPPDAAQTRRA